MLVGATAAHGQSYSVLYNFGSNAGDPASPQNNIVAQGRDGNLYSTTPHYGAKNRGAAFRISPAGTLSTLFSFTGGSNGGYPFGGLTLGTNGNFYGTASVNVFRITASGRITTLHRFTGGGDGDDPGTAPVQGTDRSFYGTASQGGTRPATMEKDVERYTKLRLRVFLQRCISSTKYMAGILVHWLRGRMANSTQRRTGAAPTA